MNISKYIAKQNGKINLSEFDTGETGDYESKKKAKKDLKNNIKEMKKLQSKLYAEDKYSVLILFQAMDAAGKDSTIKHVMSGVNPQGTSVVSFKQPSTEELNHDYLWRCSKALPERGKIGIFNRSYYEEVLVVRVHDLITKQKIPVGLIPADVWKERYRQIADYEKYLSENGTVIIKFFLHVSKEEQKKRFLSRIDKESKNWKFSASDLKERKYWDEYQKCYEEALAATSRKYAPWYIIPADHKWFMRLLVSRIIAETMEKMPINYPKLSKEQLAGLQESKKILENEK